LWQCRPAKETTQAFCVFFLSNCHFNLHQHHFECVRNTHMPKSLAQLIRDCGDAWTESPIISPSAGRFAWASITPVAMVAFQQSSTFAWKFVTVAVSTAHPWTLTVLAADTQAMRLKRPVG
jgi:hypothetical protein